MAAPWSNKTYQHALSYLQLVDASKLHGVPRSGGISEPALGQSKVLGFGGAVSIIGELVIKDRGLLVGTGDGTGATDGNGTGVASHFPEHELSSSHLKTPSLQVHTKRGKIVPQHFCFPIGQIKPSLQVNGGLNLIGCFFGHVVTGGVTSQGLYFSQDQRPVRLLQSHLIFGWIEPSGQV